MAPLRILLHTRASGGGGAERVFATLAERLAARGHRVTFAVDGVEPDYVPPPAVSLVELGPSHRRGIARLAGLIRSEGFDVLAGAVTVSDVKLAAARIMALSRAPLVISYHGFEEWKTGRLSAAAYHGMPLLRRMAARVVCVSDGLRDAMVERWGADPARTVRIYNPVAVPAVTVDAAGLAGRPPLVGAVGRLSPEKGMADLVAAFAQVATPGARLAIGGDGPERRTLETMVRDLGLTGRVDLLGAVTGPEPVFGHARIAVVPSRSEAFGMAAVEALAFGLPVVATDCAGPAEILGHGRWGRLVPLADPPALAAAIDAALAEPGNPTPRQERAADFSAARGVDEWERLFREVVAERR